MTILTIGTIVIRDYRASDLNPLVEQFCHPQILKNIRGVASPYGKKDGQSFLRKFMKKRVAMGNGIRLEYAIEIDGRFAGGLGMTLEGQKAEFGYWLGSSWWGQGYMTRIVKAFARYAFRRYKLQRLEAKVFPFNKASARVLEKSGLRYEGRLRRSHPAPGAYLDQLIFAKVARPTGRRSR